MNYCCEKPVSLAYLKLSELKDFFCELAPFDAAKYMAG